jgi:hypothetical protein
MARAGQTADQQERVKLSTFLEESFLKGGEG